MPSGAGEPPGSLEEFVRVSPRHSSYLELTDGSPYIPIGLNMIAPPGGAQADEEEAFRTFDAWLRELSKNRGNYIRVWLSNPFGDVAPETRGVYDEARAKRIDRMLALCRRYRIRVKMTMEHFRSIGGGRQAWADKPLHHVDQGGAARDIADFFDGEPSRQRFRKKIRWYADRYGNDPIIFGWELWNEVNAVRGGDYLTWTEAMLPELRRAFPKNLSLQSLGSFDRARAREYYRPHSLFRDNGLAQVHRYLDLGAELEVCHGPVDVLAADAVRELLGYGPAKPVILAESGAVEPKHAGPFRLYAADKHGVILHDVLFAPFFSGSAGPGQIWHWDQYVARNGLWWQFGRFAEAVRDLDPPAERFTPVLEEAGRLRVYRLEGRRTTLVWCRDRLNDWRSELDRGQPPEALEGIRIPAPGYEGPVRFYDPWNGQWSDGRAASGSVTLPRFSRSIVLRYTSPTR